MDLAPINGKMVESTKDIGLRISCMARVSILGQMDANTTANIKMIRKMVMALFIGPMAASTLGVGAMVNSTEKLILQQQMANSVKVFGKMANV